MFFPQFILDAFSNFFIQSFWKYFTIFLIINEVPFTGSTRESRSFSAIRHGHGKKNLLLVSNAKYETKETIDVCMEFFTKSMLQQYKWRRIHALFLGEWASELCRFFE